MLPTAAPCWWCTCHNQWVGVDTLLLAGVHIRVTISWFVPKILSCHRSHPQWHIALITMSPQQTLRVGSFSNTPCWWAATDTWSSFYIFPLIDLYLENHMYELQTEERRYEAAIAFGLSQQTKLWNTYFERNNEFICFLSRQVKDQVQGAAVECCRASTELMTKESFNYSVFT